MPELAELPPRFIKAFVKRGNDQAKRKRKSKSVPAERSLKIDLSVIGKAFVGMSLEDMSLVGKLAASIQKLPRKARKRVVAALGSIFA